MNHFKVIKDLPISELQCRLKELLHVPTGARIIHIENDDPENVFCLSFQTVPHTSNGVAHILEHVVLCGSRKFPVKDPFFAMNRRSLNTFMNALTGSDFTCYPAATQNPADFYNLLEVYLDAVFHPILDEFSFKQEGHRLEFETPDDVTTPLVHRGIVFNEMKGALNSGSARMHEALLEALFPDITYGINSGGDPTVIPELTYKTLLDFHHVYYHPSHCLFFFYGNLPLAKHLEFIEEHILSKSKPLPPLPPIPLQPRFKTGKKIHLKYPAPSGESTQDKTLISFGWLTCHALDQETCLALEVLEVILLHTDASPLKKELLQSGLCKQVSCFIDPDMSELPFAIQLKGCNPGNEKALEQVIRNTLLNIIKEGISKEAIENAIHQHEFHRSEITGDHYPYGLTLFMRSCLLAQHGGDPELGLIIHSLFDNIRKKSDEDPCYFTDLIKKWFLNNPHFVQVTLTPDTELERHEQALEKENLEEIKNHLSSEEAQKIVKQSAILKEFQEKQEEGDLDILPKVTLSDIPKKAPDYPLSHMHVGDLSVYHHDCFTNQIGYADLFFQFPSLTEKELIYSRILTVLLTQLGAGGKSYEDTLHAIQAHTGGVNSYLTLHMQAEDHNSFFPAFALRGKALKRKLPNLCALLYGFIESPDFSDLRRIEEILKKHYTGLESSLNQNALRYAVNLSASGLNLPSYVANLWYGLDYYKLIRELAENFSLHADSLLEMLTSLYKKITLQGPVDLVISSESELFETLKKHKFYELSQVSASKKTPWQCDLFLPEIEPQGRIISSPVAFVCKSFQTVSYTHPDAPALNLSSYLFDNLTLHKKIREEGGAYGSGAVCNTLSGNYYFYSYRDPNIVSSLNAFEEAIANVLDGEFSLQDLEEAKLEMIQDFDHPLSPGARADVAYHWLKEGKTLSIRQAFRKKLLATTKEEIIAAVHTHLIPQFNAGKTVVFAGRDLLQTENEKLEADGKLPLKILPLV